jgi:hypothetical protein
MIYQSLLKAYFLVLLAVIVNGEIKEELSVCFRCPQVVTRNYRPSDLMREIAMPEQLDLKEREFSLRKVYCSPTKIVISS